MGNKPSIPAAKTESLQDFIFKLLGDLKVDNKHQLAGNLAFLVNRQVCFDNERSHIELLLGYRDNGHGSVEGGGWRLILVYYGKVLLHGHYKDKRDEVLMGLLEASAKEVTDILRPQG